jgi:hypothetical protein
MKVQSHGGSFVVVYLSSNMDYYIEARKDFRYPNFSFIEVVKGGQVIHRYIEHNSCAAEHVVQLIRRYQIK